MQTAVFDKEKNPDLRVYVVWVPKSRGMERDVAQATPVVGDPRARHYWDGDSALVGGYKDTLALPEDAWDVFLLYGPDATWGDGRPPAPDYWMHQLGSKSAPRVQGPYLDAPAFLDRLRTVLRGVPAS